MISDKYTMVEFLYNINNLNNLKSIFCHGILSHNLIKERHIDHCDISNHSVQGLRDNKTIPGGKNLHDYANLYIDARNPMMFTETHNNDVNKLCVICVDKRVLDLEGTIVTDRNAAARFALFMTPDKGIESLDFDIIRLRDWTHSKPLIQKNQRQIKCAEVLVLNHVPIEYLIKIKVATKAAYDEVCNYILNVPVEIDRDIFFK